MDSPEQRPRSHIDDEYRDPLPPVGPAGVAPLQPSLNGPGARRNSLYSNIPGYTLMVAGQRSGKTSFLRLLLDTSNIAPTVSKEQLTPLAKFIQGSNGHTNHIRPVSVDVILDSPDSGAPQPVSLTLIDTPSLDFSDEGSSERVITGILDHIDSRFADTSEDVSSLLPISLFRLLCPSCDPDLSPFPLRCFGFRKRTEIIMSICKCSVFTPDAYFHSRCMRLGLIINACHP
jgi:hypothetical protein